MSVLLLEAAAVQNLATLLSTQDVADLLWHSELC